MRLKEKGRQLAEQKKRTRTTRQATQTQPALLAADGFAAALEAISVDDWCRTCATGKTIRLRRTSKRAKEVVDKMRLPAVVRLSRSLWDDARNDTAAEKIQFVLRQQTELTVGPSQSGGTSSHSSCRAVVWNDKMQRGLQECWSSAHRWRTLISAAIHISEQPGQRE